MCEGTQTLYAEEDSQNSRQTKLFSEHVSPSTPQRQNQILLSVVRSILTVLTAKFCGTKMPEKFQCSITQVLMQRPSLPSFALKQYHTVLQLDRDLLKAIQLKKPVLQNERFITTGLLPLDGCLKIRLSISIKYLLGPGLTLETD